jgi:hypothetical protein
MMLKNQMDIVLILDFDISGFFDLGICHKLFLTSLTFHLMTSTILNKNSHSLSVLLYTPFSCMDKVGNTK